LIFPVKYLAKKHCLLSFERVKRNFAIFSPHPGKNFFGYCWKNPLLDFPSIKVSDALVRVGCLLL